MQQIPGQIVGNHVLLTGPIRGPVELQDGTVVDVTPEFVDISSFSEDQIEEINFLIGEHWVKHGHPNDIDMVDGQPVQRPFVHEAAAKFDDHPGKFTGTPAGEPTPEPTTH